jgi:Protein of unknown function (DUF2721)
VFQQTQLFSSNPFGVLTAIVAPAILTNACSVLALGTSNRIARVVDRTRVVYGELARTELGVAEHGEWLEQLAALRTRGKMLLRAGLRGPWLFAASALVSVGGSIATYYGVKLLFEIAAGLAVVTGASAVIGLVTGCPLMVHETRLAVQSLTKEGQFWTHVQPSGPSSETGSKVF